MTLTLDDSHDPALRSWVASANRPGTDFPIQNLPLSVFRRRNSADEPRIGVAIGDDAVDLRAADQANLLDELPADLRSAVRQPTLHALMAAGHPAMRRLRAQLVSLLRAGSSRAEPGVLLPISDLELLLPAAIGDYTDFYASAFHATRVGRLFRPDTPLLPNYKFVPIAYHGRASSIVASGTSIRRPWGQSKSGDEAEPVLRPSRMLDYELEVGIIVGAGNELGNPIAVESAENHVFGLCLLNDWSARDVQAWEYQPLGPFLAKSFATTLSAWVVTLEALTPFRCAPLQRPEDDPAPLRYLTSLADQETGGINVELEAELSSARMRAERLAPASLGRSSLRNLYWTVAQMVTHHTVNGCNLRTADVLGTGTVSGPSDDSRGCLLEITANGQQPLTLPNGEVRGYLADGDEVILRGFCERQGFARIGFGSCRGIILPAVDRSKAVAAASRGSP